MRNVVIIGSGPAGYTAAIYAARANLNPLLIEGLQIGGQLSITTDVENFPGFPEGIMGPALMDAMKKQAGRFGTDFLPGFVAKADLSQRPFHLYTDDEEIQAKSVIICSGASARLIGLESEKRLIGYGVSTCATCDGYFFRGKEIIVIGGGDSAMEEATFLTKFANKVTVIHRRDKLRASKIMQDKAFRNPKIDFVWDTVVEDIYDVEAKNVQGVKLRNLKNDEVTDFKSDGVFVAIGHEPNTGIFQGQIEMDANGYILTHDGTKTNIPGVFAAGDVQDHVYRQAISAAGSGCMAAMDAERFLEHSEH
ncbi:MAG: thioredoxin-disulfide reductase [Acidobacteria bacterium]|nr:thioredoxin-disulfide reductase [Acidobacteriota bacterium]MCI0626223.1 thioredoxin-disulfide reductase [Acidobacteriota bacterium]MCI0717634.1 thioredoxin-disulfide reductase [Acidobacteriota bacterium]